MSISISSPNGEILTIGKQGLKFGENEVIFFFNIDKMVCFPAADAESVGSLVIVTVSNTTRSFEYEFSDNGLIEFLMDSVLEANQQVKIVYSDEYVKASKKLAEEKARLETERIRDAEEKRKESERIAAEKRKEAERIEQEVKREKERENREKATKTLKDAVSLNEGIKENAVAANSKKFAKIFEEWAERAYKWIVTLAIVESIIAIIVGFILMFDGGFGIFAIFLGSAVVWCFINFIDAAFIRFILKCKAQNYYAQAEVVQNT